MSKYKNEYKLILEDTSQKGLIVLKANDVTAKRDYDSRSVPMNSSPFFFENARAEELIENKIKENVTPIFKDFTNLIVDTEIANTLYANYELPGVHMHPAVYMQSKEKWYENYTFLLIQNELDCWDREKSNWEEDEDDETEFELDNMEFNDQFMDEIPLKDRLLFAVKGDTRIVVHNSLIPILANGDVANCGVVFLPSDAFPIGPI